MRIFDLKEGTFSEPMEVDSSPDQGPGNFPWVDFSESRTYYSNDGHLRLALKKKLEALLGQRLGRKKFRELQRAIESICRRWMGDKVVQKRNPEDLKTLAHRRLEQNDADAMAVKQKVVEVVTSSPTDARLQLILQELQSMHRLHDHCCSQLVANLGTVPVPSDPTNYMQFVNDVKSVGELLAKECATRQHLIPITLKSLYHEISSSERDLSPAMSIVVDLLHSDFIPQAIDLLLRSGYTSLSLKRALQTLCKWLCRWTWTQNLGPLVLAFIQGLESQHHGDILYEVTLSTITPLFKLLIVPESRHAVGHVVGHMLIHQVQHNADAFLKILPHIPMVCKNLHKESSDSSLFYLAVIIKLTERLMERFPDHADQYAEINKELQPFLTNETVDPQSKGWADGVDAAISMETSVTGKVGLSNLGNTCYMNSVLQALFMTKAFRNEVLLYNKQMESLFVKLQLLFALLQHSQKPCLAPSDILALARPPGFLMGQQHDSSEFLGYLLDTLHELERNASGSSNAEEVEGAGALTTITATPSSSSSYNSGTIVQAAFGGKSVTVSRCGQCDTRSERTDSFRELQLSFPNNSDDQSVQSLLDYYVQPEKLSGDNQYHCDTCGCLTDGERVTVIEGPPSRLILTLKHFRYDPASHSRTKLLQRVTLDSQVVLDMRDYDLYAAVVHRGTCLDAGHYFTYAREGDQWFKFNDSSVTKSSAEELFGLTPPETPYILFYGRRDCHEPETLAGCLLPQKLQMQVHKDNAEYELSRRRRPVPTKTYNTRLSSRNDEPPPPGCGGGGFPSSNMFVC